jgi:hypothetical protein
VLEFIHTNPQEHTMPTTLYTEAKAIRDGLEAALRAAGNILQTYPRNSMGLVSDAIRTTPEYQAHKAAHDKAFHNLRTYNTAFVKAFKKEIQAERKARYTQGNQ